MHQIDVFCHSQQYCISFVEECTAVGTHSRHPTQRGAKIENPNLTFHNDIADNPTGKVEVSSSSRHNRKVTVPWGTSVVKQCWHLIKMGPKSKMEMWTPTVGVQNMCRARQRLFGALNVTVQVPCRSAQWLWNTPDIPPIKDAQWRCKGVRGTLLQMRTAWRGWSKQIVDQIDGRWALLN
jgi:hypothetical protein